MKKVCRFDELTCESLKLAGGKARVLALLYQKGYPVPEGFVILPQAFPDGRLDPHEWEKVRTYMTDIRKKDKKASFAVRSSASSEDSADASFAGGFETVLGAKTENEVYQAVCRVQSSSTNKRVLSYGEAKGITVEQKVAVIIQKLVNADFAGVLFTADPVTGNRLHMTGNYVTGLGERLVSGEANAESFILEKPKGTYEGPDEIRFATRHLYKLASRLERLFGCPQDIEWAIQNKKLYLLQSRPVTTLNGYSKWTGEWNDSLTGDYLWSNVNLSEAVPDIMTPATWSMLQLEIEAGTVFDIPGNHPVIGNICGRPYFNFGLLTSLPCSLGMKKQNVARQMENTYGMVPDGVEIPLLPLSRLKLLAGFVSAAAKLAWSRKNIKHDVQDYLSGNPSWCHEVRKRTRDIRDADMLIKLWRDELEPRFRLSCRMLKYGMDRIEPAIKLRMELEELIGVQDAAILLSNLRSGTGMLASLGPVTGLSKVAEGSMSKAEYIELYGHRSEHEVELSIPRPGEGRDWLDRMLADYVKTGISVEALMKRQQSEYAAAWGRFKSKYPSRAESIAARLVGMAEGAKLRENVRSEFTRLAWAIREFALKAGELTGLGKDIFFLSLPEMIDVLAGNDAAVSLIPTRSKTYAAYCSLPHYPAIIRGRFDPFNWASDPDRRSDIFTRHIIESTLGDVCIKGFAGAPGTVEGIVRRLDSPEEIAILEKGEILVTAIANIGWTPLFPKAAAIVTDVGAPLSHAAIVARELGIPAVVGCISATTLLHTGDRIVVDGGTGIVKVLEASLKDSAAV